MRLLVDSSSILLTTIFSNNSDIAESYDDFISRFEMALNLVGAAPKDVVLVLDGPDCRKARRKDFPEYKLHRKHKDEDVYQVFVELTKRVKKLVKSYGGIVCYANGFEADDVIAKIASRVANCVIWSTDKDMLYNECPVILNHDIYMKEDAGDKFGGLKRRHIRLYRTLVGDSGDFGTGSGVKGFGHKTFLAMRKEFGDSGLDTLCEITGNRQIKKLEEDVADFKPIQKIIDSASTVYKMWGLTGPVHIKSHKLKFEVGYASNPGELKQWDSSITLVTADNYEELLPTIKKHISESDYIAFDIETDVPPESHEWLQRINDNIKNAKMKVDVFASYIVGGAVTCGRNHQHTYYFSVKHKDTNNISLEQFKAIVLNHNKRIIAHNAAGFELPVCKINFGEWLPDCMCSQIAASYVDENSAKGLKVLSKRWLGYQQVSYEQVTDGKGMSELTAEHVLAYGADDTIMTSALFNLFSLIMQIEQTYDAYKEVEQYSMYATASAFVDGVRVDLDVLEQLKKEDEAEADKARQVLNSYLIKLGWGGTKYKPIDKLTKKNIQYVYRIITGQELKTKLRSIKKIAGVIKHQELPQLVLSEDIEGINKLAEKYFKPDVQFNVRSSVQKKRLFYELMGFPVRFRKKLTDVQKKAGKKQGNPGTDEDCIKWMIKYDANEEQKESLKALLRILNFETRKSLYYDTYKYYVHWKDGLLHPFLNQSSTTSRRFAPAKPNVNQLPKRNEEGRKIRRCVVPYKKGHVLLAPDISGQELRLGAWVSQDENFLACYIGDNKKDLHTLTGLGICLETGKEFKNYDEIKLAVSSGNKLAKSYRTKGKNTNFLTQYSDSEGGEYTLSKKQQIPEPLAKKFIAAKDRMFPGIKRWKQKNGLLIRKRGYSLTLLGARRHVHKQLRYGDAKHVLRSALNNEIQGSAAEMLKLIMGRMFKSGMLERYNAVFYFPIHDQLVASVPEENAEALCSELGPIISYKYADMEVPIESDLTIGKNLCDLEEYEWPQ